MLVRPKDLARYWAIAPNGVLHVGAHLAEEKPLYQEANWGSVIWIEAQPKLAEELESRLKALGDRVLCAAIWEQNDEVKHLNISSNSGSSSILDFGTHKKSYPDISFTNQILVLTKRLDAILLEEEVPNFLNLDIQGVELQALKSLGDFINRIDYIYVEINTKEVYIGCSKLSELDEFLYEKGFKRIITRRYIRHGWGEALYSRNRVNLKRAASFYPRVKNAFGFYYPQFSNFVKYLSKGGRLARH